jgi:serine phosphatase RsbU (regulator of sigma subunit)
MPRGRDWLDLVRTTFRSVSREEMSGLYSQEWRLAREKLTAGYRDEIERKRGRVRRFLATTNAVLFGLAQRLAPARRILFGAALLLVILSLLGPFETQRTRHLRDGQTRNVTNRVDFGGFRLASVTLLTLLLAMELVDKINYRDELDLARELQASLIPKSLPGFPGFELGAFNRIANLVGGDIYDFVLMPDGRLAALFGDASGHGMAAGLIMAVAHAAFRTQLEVDAAPQAVFATLNRILCRTGGPRSFFGCVYLLLSPDGSFTVSVAGHPSLLRIGVAGEVLERFGKGAYPLGVKTPLDWERQDGRIGARETLLLHSDGVTEARDASGAEFGDARLESSVRRAATLPAPAFVAALSNDVMAFCGHQAPEDDVSIAALRRLA